MGSSKLEFPWNYNQPGSYLTLYRKSSPSYSYSLWGLTLPDTLLLVQHGSLPCQLFCHLFSPRLSPTLFCPSFLILKFPLSVLDSCFFILSAFPFISNLDPITHHFYRSPSSFLYCLPLWSFHHMPSKTPWLENATACLCAPHLVCSAWWKKKKTPSIQTHIVRPLWIHVFQTGLQGL